jgi:hypothetical protein
VRGWFVGAALAFGCILVAVSFTVYVEDRSQEAIFRCAAISHLHDVRDPQYCDWRWYDTLRNWRGEIVWFSRVLALAILVVTAWYGPRVHATLR